MSIRSKIRRRRRIHKIENVLETAALVTLALSDPYPPVTRRVVVTETIIDDPYDPFRRRYRY